MTEKHIDIAEVYDNPAAHMTFAGVFGYVRVDLIPFRATIRRAQAWL